MIDLTFEFDEHFLDNFTKKKLEEIRDAVYSAAVEIKNIARTNMKASPYRLNEIADKGILLGTLKKDYIDPKAKLHPFGTEDKGYLARIFEGSKEKNRFNRYKKKGGPLLKTARNTGYVKPTHAINSSLDQTILDNKIRGVLNK